MIWNKIRAFMSQTVQIAWAVRDNVYKSSNILPGVSGTGLYPTSFASTGTTIPAPWKVGETTFFCLSLIRLVVMARVRSFFSAASLTDLTICSSFCLAGPVLDFSFLQARSLRGNTQGTCIKYALILLMIWQACYPVCQNNDNITKGRQKM